MNTIGNHKEHFLSLTGLGGVADLSEPGVVEEPGVGRVAGNNHLGPEQLGRHLQYSTVQYSSIEYST